MTKEMPLAFPKVTGKRFIKGRDNKAQWSYGNFSLEPKEADGVFILNGQMLKKVEQVYVSS